uniref:TGF_BETA_2 domain-containing protein n=1 Tax=Panagrellus redivivus TaxID=6233 RepID=A0A7E4VHU6_PANRE
MYLRGLIILCLHLATICGIYIDNDDGTTREIKMSVRDKNKIAKQMLTAWGIRRPGSRGVDPDSYLSLFMASAYKFHTDDLEDEIRFNPSYSDLDSKTTYFGYDRKLRGVLDHDFDVIVAFEPKHIVTDTPLTDALGSNLAEIDFSNEDTDYPYELVHAGLYFAVDSDADFSVKNVQLYYTVADEIIKMPSGVSFPINDTNFVAFNVSKIVEGWMRHPEMSRRLYVRITDNKGKSRPLDGLLSHLHAFGVGFFIEGDEYYKNRHPRDAGFLEDDDANEIDDGTSSTPIPDGPIDVIAPPRTDTCRKRALFIDFSDLGWTDFIVAPHGYRANYCAGGCPFPLDGIYHPTNHALFQTLVHLLHKNVTGEALCAPTMMDKSMSLLFLDKNQVRIKKYADMSVTECGCQ